MDRLTQKDGQGNWSLKGLAWKSLYAGEVVTEETWEKLYGALWKLKDYEDAGYAPEQIQDFNEMYLDKCKEVNALRERQQWIPATERLPDEGQEALVTRTSMIGNYVTTDEYDWDYCAWASDADDIIAWMPLPEPYKERGEG